MVLLEQLEEGIFRGNEIQGMQGKIYKVRVSSSDQNKGKRGGFRFIYYVDFINNIVYMMTVYAKSKQEDLSHRQIQEIKRLIKE